MTRKKRSKRKNIIGGNTTNWGMSITRNAFRWTTPIASSRTWLSKRYKWRLARIYRHWRTKSSRRNVRSLRSTVSIGVSSKSLERRSVSPRIRISRLPSNTSINKKKTVKWLNSKPSRWSDTPQVPNLIWITRKYSGWTLLRTHNLRLWSPWASSRISFTMSYTCQSKKYQLNPNVAPSNLYYPLRDLLYRRLRTWRSLRTSRKYRTLENSYWPRSRTPLHL